MKFYGCFDIPPLDVTLLGYVVVGRGRASYSSKSFGLLSWAPRDLSGCRGGGVWSKL